MILKYISWRSWRKHYNDDRYYIQMITNETALGKIIRFPLRFIPKSFVLPILSGAARGMKWVKGSGVNGYWLGIYEKSQQVETLKRAKPEMVAYDVGAHAGFYSLIFSKYCRRVFAFEPSEKNRVFIREHLKLNKITNVFLLPEAVSNYSGRANFKELESSAQGRLSDEGYEVSVISIDDFVKENPPPDIIKIDVEGEEFNAVKGAEETLKKYAPVLFVATDDKPESLYVEFFNKVDYKITHREKNFIIAEK